MIRRERRDSPSAVKKEKHMNGNQFRLILKDRSGSTQKKQEFVPKRIEIAAMMSRSGEA